METISSDNPMIRCRCEEIGREVYISPGDKVSARMFGVSEEFAHALGDTWEEALDEALDAKGDA
jgi:hypothetical protein